MSDLGLFYYCLYCNSLPFGCFQGYSDARTSSLASKRQRVDNGSPPRQRKIMQDTDIDQSSGAEDDMSD